MKLPIVYTFAGYFYGEQMSNFVKCLPTSMKMKSIWSQCKIGDSLMCHWIMFTNVSLRFYQYL